MTVDVKVPVLAESIPDATLLEWRKQPGDWVEQDEILIELETDKVVLEVPAPASGVLAEVLKQTGDTALSQEVLARIDAGESASTAAPGSAADTASKAVPLPFPPHPVPALLPPLSLPRPRAPLPGPHPKRLPNLLPTPCRASGPRMRTPTNA